LIDDIDLEAGGSGGANEFINGLRDGGGVGTKTQRNSPFFGGVNGVEGGGGFGYKVNRHGFGKFGKSAIGGFNFKFKWRESLSGGRKWDAGEPAKTDGRRRWGRWKKNRNDTFGEAPCDIGTNHKNEEIDTVADGFSRINCNLGEISSHVFILSIAGSPGIIQCKMKVRTRFAPSPTGSMHIGNLRTAFYAYALAKHNDGDFVVRIENTDQKREKEGGVEEINELLQIFNLKHDEYHVQSERLELYKKAAEELVAEGHAFYCQCLAKNAKLKGYSKELRDPCRDKGLTDGAIKLRVPDGERVSFTDFVLQKQVEWETSGVGDSTLLKSDGFPTYHLAVVVDDHDMGITHVLRGHDWMPSTPIHLLVHKYLGYALPEIGHLTDILDPDGGKLSKRKGSTSVRGLLNEGYLPEALFNFVILAGWAPKDNRELFTLDEFVAAFDPRGFQKANPVFNRAKLDWFNGQYIQKTENAKLKTQIYDFYKGKYNEEIVEKTVPLVKTRMEKLSEYEELCRFLFESVEVDKSLLGKEGRVHLVAVIDVLEKVEWELTEVNSSLMKLIEDEGFKVGQFFMSLRVAVTGKKISPPINESMIILGKKETLKRIKQAL